MGQRAALAVAQFAALAVSGAFLSPDWYRVAHLKLRRSSHVQMARHVYRGQVWYVIQDLQGGKFHRISEQAHAFFARLNGQRTVQDLWEQTCKLYPDAPPSQPELIQLLSQMHNSDLVTGDRRPNMQEVDRRAREEARKTTVGYFKNPMSLRIPLFDPEPMLRRMLPIAKMVFSPLGGALWVALMLVAAAVAFMSWDRLETPKAESILTAANITYLAVAYIFVKLFHELGHGLAIKRWGGEVREVGVMMLVFFPVPYVDASQSSFFPYKTQRMIVSSAGILVELTIAAVALIIWSVAEQGAVATLAYNLFLIGGVSTLLFNGNPLLRFDGYFVFADWIESPNLGQRSNQYFWYMFQKKILGHDDARPPLFSPGEEAWLLGYSISAFVYRMFVMVIISLYVATAIPVLGVAIVLLSLYLVFVVPAAKGIRFLAADQSLDIRRGAAVTRLVALAAAFVAALLFVPFPHSTVADAVLQPGAETLVRAQGSGLVEKLIARNGHKVEAGAPVMQLSEPLLDQQTALASAELEDARLRLDFVPIGDANARAVWTEQVAFRQTRRDDLDRKANELIVRAPSAGILALPGQHRIVGSLVRQGDIVGSILSSGGERWRTAVPADRAEFVDNDLIAVDVRLLTAPDVVFAATIVSRSPEVTTRLDSFGLTNRAGGRLVADPTQEAPVSIDPVVTYAVAATDWTPEFGPLPAGSRAEIRITHSPAPLAPRIWRAVRRTFLVYFGA